MRSDHQFYTIFHDNPELLPCILPLPEDHDYSFDSLTVKKLERRLDGYVSSPDPMKPIYVVEFQARPDEGVTLRVVVEVGSLQLDNMETVVRGLLIYPSREHDKALEDWEYIFTEGDVFGKLYLDELVKELGEHHPLSAVFAPFLEENKEIIKAKARQWYQNISQSNLSPKGKESLEEVFFSWLSSQFNTLNREEVEAMLDLDIRFEDTQLYRDFTDPLFREIEKKDSAIKSAVMNLHNEGRSNKDVAGILNLDVKVIVQILEQQES